MDTKNTCVSKRLDYVLKKLLTILGSIVHIITTVDQYDRSLRRRIFTLTRNKIFI